MAGQPMYEIEIRHEELNKYRHIRGRDPHVVEQKARAQLASWDEQWQRKKEAEAKKAVRQRAIEEKEKKKEVASERTEEAKDIIASLDKTLAHTLSIDDAIDWNELRNAAEFPKPKPQQKPTRKPPPEPRLSDAKFRPNIGFFDKLIPGRKRHKLELARQEFVSAHADWEIEKNQLRKRNDDILMEHGKQVENWEEEKRKFQAEQEVHNTAIEEQKKRYLNKDVDAIVEYCDLVLSRSIYPDFMPQEYDLSMNSQNGMLIVDYRLPSVEDLPNLKEVKYIQSRDDFQEIYMKQNEINRIYDDLVYQISLRTLHEIFESDVVSAIAITTFNGWVEYTDKSTGKDARSCIVSIQAEREAFLDINLANVDAKACFRALKGVGSTKLHGMAPVPPLAQIEREDSRFVEHVDIAHALESGTNLATIDWQEFEHLIREIFEKELSNHGGEVRVTRASRDGGVDAVAFDPDPIRGGKIVIQAKRYTNAVSVSAVRDLYGTVMNEGASKGILVTTSSYGPDAYEFAKDKPITLLDGSNLLHLLGKFGHKARIDLDEAKSLLSEGY